MRQSNTVGLLVDTDFIKEKLANSIISF